MKGPTEQATAFAELLQRAGRPELLDWWALRPGVAYHALYGRPGQGPAAALLRYASGAEVPVHEHSGYEYILVLEGVQEDVRGRYPPGTLVVNPPGSRHAVRSVEGCIVLAIWERPIRFL